MENVNVALTAPWRGHANACLYGARTHTQTHARMHIHTSRFADQADWLPISDASPGLIGLFGIVKNAGWTVALVVGSRAQGEGLTSEWVVLCCLYEVAYETTYYKRVIKVQTHCCYWPTSVKQHPQCRHRAQITPEGFHLGQKRKNRLRSGKNVERCGPAGCQWDHRYSTNQLEDRRTEVNMIELLHTYIQRIRTVLMMQV